MSGAILLATMIVALLMASTPASAAGETPGSVTGLPVPRFVSLKSDRVNVRGGPQKEQEVRWVYTRAGMPVEITAEYENWRRIRDWEGAEGWVYHSLLSGRRTALVISKAMDELVPLFYSADEREHVVARLQPGVVASVRRCTGKVCHIVGSGFDGWIAQERLWGVYRNETLP